MTLTRRSFTALALASVARDVVAYFGLSRGDGVMGSEEFATMHKGTTFHFANAENLATFQGDPDKYAPRFGGYCAFAMSSGYFDSCALGFAPCVSYRIG